MTTKLDELRALILCLELDHGIKVACVGGAARDTYLGREPKDYDLVVLSKTDFLSDLAMTLLTATGSASIQELSPEDIESYTKDEDDRGLRAVFELRMPTLLGAEYITIQVLVFSDAVTARYNGDPHNVVEDHDCDLSKAWLEDVGGRLVPRVHPEFPSPFNGNTNHFQPGYCNHERKRYIAAKFPEFNHR